MAPERMSRAEARSGKHASRASLFFAALLLTAIAASILAPSPHATAPAPDRAGRAVCATLLDGTCKVKPRKLIMGARGIVRSIKWKSWGGQKAVGFGRFKYVASAGEPPSASVGPTRARVKFTKIRSCDGRDRYQRLTLKYGPGFDKTWTKGPYNSCEFLKAKGRPLPKLYGGAATDYTRKALVREFPFTSDPTSRDIDCKKRLSRVKFKCRVSFFAGDSSYRGNVKVRHILKAGDRLGYRYAMRLTYTNEYCIHGLDKPRDECQKKIKEKGNGYA